MRPAIRLNLTARDSFDARFEADREAALRHLVRIGIPVFKAQAWLAAWDESTLQLRDFRNAADFWDQGYLFALEEYRRGHDPLAS